MKTLTKEEFIERAKCLLGDNYDFTKTTYITSKIKTIITCKIHGDFLVTPSNVLQHSSGCPYCSNGKISRSKIYTTQEFIRKAIKIHGKKYSYDLAEYVNCKTKIKIICPIHGVFEQLPYNHLRGCGCPKCAIERRKSNPSFED